MAKNGNWSSSVWCRPGDTRTCSRDWPLSPQDSDHSTALRVMVNSLCSPPGKGRGVRWAGVPQGRLRWMLMWLNQR